MASHSATVLLLALFLASASSSSSEASETFLFENRGHSLFLPRDNDDGVFFLHTDLMLQLMGNDGDVAPGEPR